MMSKSATENPEIELLISVAVYYELYRSKKCLCNVADCGKCLTLGCTDDGCNNHRLITKWRYRKRLLESLGSKVENLRDNKAKKGLATLRKDIKTCEEEIKRLSEVMRIKQW